ncbi:hypothetical protein [Acinetobacter guerrae]|uniref:hypothetical protein n=1 Tax=Acinetobacter guerrae TaxID=1843371 RepID=UPI00128B0E97|nr:hypothetical protein [Acinetobacter guerrae]MPW43327.1 hypothetical protein [Acinetobacter guerrae]
MIKQFSFIIVLFFSSISIACSNSNQAVDSSSQNARIPKGKIDSKDLQIIEKYNEILKKIATNNLSTVQTELRNFLPQALEITNKKERNLVLMNIYTQTKMYPEALELNSSLIKDNPNNLNAYKFQCLLLKTLNEPNNKIKNCYVILSTKLKTNLNALKSSDPIYKYAEWAYFSAMLHAGNSEYKDKLKSIVSSQKDTDSKLQFESMYDAEISNQILPK